MFSEFKTILKCLCRSTGGAKPLCGVDADLQLDMKVVDGAGICRNLNAAFLICLCGGGGTQEERARRCLQDFEDHERWGPLVRFYERGLQVIPAEIAMREAGDGGCGEGLKDLAEFFGSSAGAVPPGEAVEAVWRVFFPEGEGLFGQTEEAIQALRRRRAVCITDPNPDPIKDPGAEILFTSNVLLTLPAGGRNLDKLALGPALKERLRKVAHEPQLFWYDHPIPVGVGVDENEIVYGLRMLNEAVAFEKRHGVISSDTRVACVLSVSVTHAGLKGLARDYLRDSLASIPQGLPHLRVFMLTEDDARLLQDKVFDPAARQWLQSEEVRGLSLVFGVDGEYGRHYSFLKAIAAFWQVFVDPAVKATFKIDLDQVFPQEKLVRETGMTAFSHFKTPLWGATGIDSSGRRVSLGMIAGALLNYEDAEGSLFTPDVPLPQRDGLLADDWVFFSPLPQAVSTRAEMMARYDGGRLDGHRGCIQRVHVTGGTCGILVNSLRRYRPFTPTFIGRAEDQAYLLSVLFSGGEERLRYLHQPGLIMRHDKHVFAGEAVRAAAVGKLVGDYLRLLLFTHYAAALPWPFKTTKEAVDPFTGCFISRLPFTVVYLRLALRGARFFVEGRPGDGLEFLEAAAARVFPLVETFRGNANPLVQRFQVEREAWEGYYGILEHLEDALRRGDGLAAELKRRALEIMGACEVHSP